MPNIRAIFYGGYIVWEMLSRVSRGADNAMGTGSVWLPLVPEHLLTPGPHQGYVGFIATCTIWFHKVQCCIIGCILRLGINFPILTSFLLIDVALCVYLRSLECVVPRTMYLLYSCLPFFKTVCTFVIHHLFELLYVLLSPICTSV